MDHLPQAHEVLLPPLVENTIKMICEKRNQNPPKPEVRQMLASLGEEDALQIVKRIQNSPGLVRNLSSLIHHRIRDAFPAFSAAPGPSAACSSPPAAPSAGYPSPPAASLRAGPWASYSSSFSAVAEPSIDHPSSFPDAAAPLAARSFPIPDASAGCEGSSFRAENFGSFHSTTSGDVGSSRVNRRLPFDEVVFRGMKNSDTTNNLLMILDQLEFRKLFLLLCYIGRHKLEEILNSYDAHTIVGRKDIPMSEFESWIWGKYGTYCLKAEDRQKSAQWDSGRTHLYYCDVFQDGSFSFRGPCLTATRTHLQRSLGDENVLIVKFIGEEIENANIVSTDGILVGLKRYHFFVFKDENKDKKKDRNENGTGSVSKNVKCYFVNLDSVSLSGVNEVRPFPLRKVAEARCLFMHIHMVSSMAKYMARFSLILSKTIKFPVDLSSVGIEIIEDIPCRYENGLIVHGEDGKPLIHTDGTGFISEDLARLYPQDFGSAKYVKDKEFQKFRDVIGFTDLPSGGSSFEALNWEPPLLMQCRLFRKGLAVKGTLLLNRKLRRTIQVRPSMVKVERDDQHSLMLPGQTFDSLEIVAVSQKPRRNYLSKNLIALLSYGGVPRNFFLDLLASALNDNLLVFSDMRAAMKVSILMGELDDDYTAARMISAGVPLNEPHLQDRLSKLAKMERTNLKNGKLPIGESFYLMGTTDPTGVLDNNEVCVILENGQISGKVLVYRNPCLHFGDIHVMDAVYVKDLEDIIGNSKYGIFFSTKGRRSAAAEMGNGDFDGDMYWVSRNPQLLRHFRASEPWSRIYNTPTPPSFSKKPSDYSSEENLEAELFRQFKKARKPSSSMATAADSWQSFMDQLLTKEDCRERENLKQKMLKLIDIYYDAIDAPKSGKKINVPPPLIAKDFPHYMEKGQGRSYHSSSILGEMYNRVQEFESKGSEEGIWKLPFFDQCLQTRSLEPFLNLWRKRYEEYRKEMSDALRTGSNDSRNANADEVVRKYKLLLYGAEEFYESRKDSTEIYNAALAIYHVSYDHAMSRNERPKCGFAWKVAGPALCKLLAFNQNENPILILPSVQKALL